MYIQQTILCKHVKYVSFFFSENMVSFHKYRQHWHPQTSQKKKRDNILGPWTQPIAIRTETEPSRTEPRAGNRERPPVAGHCSVSHGIFGNLWVTDVVSQLCWRLDVLSFHIVGGGKYWFLLCHTPTRILTYSNGIIKYKNKINTVNNCYKKNIVFCFVFWKKGMTGVGVHVEENHQWERREGRNDALQAASSLSLSLVQ